MTAGCRFLLARRSTREADRRNMISRARPIRISGHPESNRPSEVMNIVMTSDGLFDTATDVQRTDPPGSDGTFILTFDSCNSGTVEYDIPSISMKGIVPIQRVAGDNIALCEALSAD